ncbi:SPOR domain-containing protein [Devosia sp. CN2-171]|uniref:SPOR domain-containing protein n=1 Tax=Devosia sp. CN2-171 TaxID=3400909 RepID=UPI003BF7BF24
MTARPQQMPDGQEKSDDLIAELAKLMASNAGSPEPEPRPAPKLVTLPDAPAPQAPAPSPVRIPGMDAPAAPVAAAPTPAAPPSAPAPGVFRIPGMDQPVSAPVAATAPAPTTVAPTLAPTITPPAAKPAASIDFGTLPAASTFKPEPMSSWQDREIPKPVASRPIPAAVIEPSRPAPVSVTPPVSAPAFAPVAAPAPAPVFPAADPTIEMESAFAKPVQAEPAPAPAAPVVRPAAAPAAPMVAAAQASPATDNFDFDFGFATSPPEPIAPQAKAPTPAPAPKPASSGDPIADLIAAELDTAEVEEPPQSVQPAPRPFPQPGLAPAPAPRPQPNLGPGRGPAPVAQPAVRAEDRFGVAPVFGPTSKVQAPRPQPAADPMDEIESLIGEAVRVELTSDKPVAPAAAPTPAPQQTPPVVPPLTTGFAPRRATIKDTEPQVASAEAAILAAAAASGAEVGRIDGVRAEPSPYKRVKAKPERRSGGMRQYVGMAVAGTLLLAAGFGLYWVLGMGRSNDAEAPVLTADATPVKEPPPPAVAAPTNQGSVVFNELDGNAAAPTDEQLVSRDDSEATSVADVATTVGDESGDTGESELANRKVRTVTVRPDGTIVSGDEAVAGNEELPVDRPAVPELPGADVQPSELLAALPSGTADAATAAGALTDPAAATDSTQVSALTETPPTGATIDPTIVAPIPVARPTDRSVLGGGANQPIAAAQPVDLGTQTAATQPAPVSSGGSGPYVQLSSQPTEADAQSSLRATQNRLSGLLAGRSLAVRQVNLGAKGTWYRVVLPVDSFQEATQTCASLKANGVDCVPIGG